MARGTRSKRHRLVGTGALAFALLAVLAALVPSLVTRAPAQASNDLLPDLGMAYLDDLRVRDSGGRRLLRFTTVMVNVGRGPLEVRGTRSGSSSTMPAVQRIFNSSGGRTDVPISGTELYYSGDGHDHWHVRDLEQYTLESLKTGQALKYGAKRGFCLWDIIDYRDLPGHRHPETYESCGRRSSSSVTMGVSVGWGDEYYYTLPDQWIDITGLTSGNYRIRAVVDPQTWFRQDNPFTGIGQGSNNETWVDFRLKGKRVTILDYGAAA